MLVIVPTAKVATCDDSSFKLEKGVEVNVYFTYANTVSTALTLNVNSTGAKTIYFIGGSTNGYYKIRSASICQFIYDGTYWRVVGNSPRGETDSTSAAALSTNPYYVTERDVYYGLPKINGSKTYNSNTSIYAPTTVGSSGQVLQDILKNDMQENRNGNLQNSSLIIFPVTTSCAYQ